jgi:hypothetical protein
MKKSFYAIGIIILFVCTQAIAQKSETALLAKVPVENNPLLNPTTEAKVKSYSLAEEGFNKEFKNVKNAEWVAKDDGYRVTFMKDGILTAVDYTKKGSMYSIIRYGKALMTKDIRTLINNSFDNPSVIEVSEVKIANYGGKVYIILLEDKTSLKTVQVMDYEVKVIHEESK